MIDQTIGDCSNYNLTPFAYDENAEMNKVDTFYATWLSPHLRQEGRFLVAKSPVYQIPSPSDLLPALSYCC